MRIVFLGSPAEAIAPLKMLHQLQQSGQHELVAVVSQPARPRGRKNVLADPPVATYAKEHGITLMQPTKASTPEFLTWMQSLQPDLCITAAFGQILTEAFLAIPRRGTINIHPSLLPAYRGATPVPAALLDGQSESGVTILFTVKQLDAGHIILQRREPITTEDTTSSLLARLFAIGSDMLPEALALLMDQTFIGMPQDTAAATHCRKINKEDGKICWRLSRQEILQRYRAYYPWPGSFTFCTKGRLVITAVTMPDDTVSSCTGLAAYEFMFDKKQQGLLVGAADGCLLVKAVIPAGSKEIDARSFWNGLGIKDKGRFHDDQ